jgi:hypothetical protein
MTEHRVTLREHFSGFANVPSTFQVLGRDVAPRTKNQDDGTGRDVVVLLPAAYALAQSVTGELMVYDAAGKHCPIYPGKGDSPMLVTDAGEIVLPIVSGER